MQKFENFFRVYAFSALDFSLPSQNYHISTIRSLYLFMRCYSNWNKNWL